MTILPTLLYHDSLSDEIVKSLNRKQIFASFMNEV